MKEQTRSFGQGDITDRDLGDQCSMMFVVMYRFIRHTTSNEIKSTMVCLCILDSDTNRFLGWLNISIAGLSRRYREWNVKVKIVGNAATVVSGSNAKPFEHEIETASLVRTISCPMEPSDRKTQRLLPSMVETQQRLRFHRQHKHERQHPPVRPLGLLKMSWGHNSV